MLVGSGLICKVADFGLVRGTLKRSGKRKLSPTAEMLFDDDMPVRNNDVAVPKRYSSVSIDSIDIIDFPSSPPWTGDGNGDGDGDGDFDEDGNDDANAIKQVRSSSATDILRRLNTRSASNANNTRALSSIVEEHHADRRKLEGFAQSSVMSGTSGTSGTSVNKASEDQEYYISTHGQLAVRWSAPESIKDGLFSQASDVWSFGILLHEVWTDGAQPYAGASIAEVTTEVANGYRMPAPKDCSPDLFKVISKCFDGNPKRRPRFKDLEKTICRLTPDGARLTLSGTTSSLRAIQRELAAEGAAEAAAASGSGGNSSAASDAPLPVAEYEYSDAQCYQASFEDSEAASLPVAGGGGGGGMFNDIMSMDSSMSMDMPLPDDWDEGEYSLSFLRCNFRVAIQ